MLRGGTVGTDHYIARCNARCAKASRALYPTLHQRQHLLADPIGFLKARRTGENEHVRPQLHQCVQLFPHLLVAAHDLLCLSAAQQAEACPDIRFDNQVLVAVERGRPVGALAVDSLPSPLTRNGTAYRQGVNYCDCSHLCGFCCAQQHLPASGWRHHDPLSGGGNFALPQITHAK